MFHVEQETIMPNTAAGTRKVIMANYGTAGDSWGNNDAQYKAYVLRELKTWADEQGEIYRENGWS
jgi:hypothetical protein